MENIIIVEILVVLFIVGMRATWKHFKGEGGCCGGSGKPEVIPEKKLSHVIKTKTVKVDGMSCERCKSWVEKAINGIDGASAKVNLKKHEAVVSMEREVSDDEIRTAVKNAGYRVVDIR